MNKEKLIKQQAREALKGNLSSLMAAMGMITLCVTTLITLFLLLVIALRIIDIDSDELKAGMELPLLGVYALCGLPGVACLPMVNGFMRMSGDAVIKGSCEFSELFYFYRRPLRFLEAPDFHFLHPLSAGGVRAGRQPRHFPLSVLLHRLFLPPLRRADQAPAEYAGLDRAVLLRGACRLLDSVSGGRSDEFRALAAAAYKQILT